MTKTFFVLLIAFFSLLVDDSVFASAETATLVVSGKIEQCESLDDDAKCEKFIVPQEELSVPLRLIASGEGTRTWIGVISDRKEINGIKIKRGIVVFRVYTDEGSGQKLNTVSAWQTIEPELENERPAAIATGIQDLDALPITMLFNPPRKINEKILSSEIAIYGKNAANNYNGTLISPPQNEMLSKILRDHFEKK